MAKKKKQEVGLPGRPAMVRGRSGGAVITVKVTPLAHALLDKHRGNLSTGDAIETLVTKAARSVKLPKAKEDETNGKWEPKRFHGRSEKLVFRLGAVAVVKLDQACAREKANRPDIIEALVREHAASLGG